MRRIKKNRPKRLKRSFIPNVATVFNMFLGFLAITLILNGEPIKAGWVMMVGVLFDVIDGKLARLLGLTSRFGTEFDSLADTISFCAVPSILVYSIYVEGLPNLLGAIISFMPLLFGTIRLAKFNIDTGDNPKPYFMGLTTPLAAITIISFMLYNFQLYGDMGDPRLALVLVAILSFLMVSPVRFSKFPLLSFKKGRSNNMRLVGLMVILLGIILFRGLVLFPLMAIYIFWSITQWMLDHDRFEEDAAPRPPQKEYNE
ncbi:MAG: CDP-diacylglycerol--serine O-phosphatidyltransferase [Candidatus Marinimicrobia bacterium]|nr:CDP-diacylglycerol--serine O-phosphatidyltransferase [Candidatus Neomarinimicrobiota bacterium]MBL7009797.1 CDP-diacylglycerol--serine O-phosphatidyltransferase [Candidatus Neomarinimicrobiota bacterium]MBL7029799.1 CDP-diacylglycerol--serine O-phosphatidyltransferase [Candidatus Neomarinimicrobiota bacterium]